MCTFFVMSTPIFRFTTFFNLEIFVIFRSGHFFSFKKLFQTENDSQQKRSEETNYFTNNFSSILTCIVTLCRAKCLYFFYRKRATHSIFHYRFCAGCHCFQCFLLIIKLRWSTFTIIVCSVVGFCSYVCSFICLCVSFHLQFYLSVSFARLHSFHCFYFHSDLTLTVKSNSEFVMCVG